jgi:type IV pilus assembly protein PilX
MAGNLRDHNVAFQAAEAGLQAASSLIAGLGQAVDLEDLAFAEEGCGVVSDACVLPDKQTVRDEGTAYDALPNVEAGLEGVSAQPKVMISYRFVEDSGLAFGDVSRGKGTYFCTVGVLGVGVSEGASVMLQTTIPKRF